MQSRIPLTTLVLEHVGFVIQWKTREASLLSLGYHSSKIDWTPLKWAVLNGYCIVQSWTPVCIYIEECSHLSVFTAGLGSFLCSIQSGGQISSLHWIQKDIKQHLTSWICFFFFFNAECLQLQCNTIRTCPLCTHKRMYEFSSSMMGFYNLLW